MATAYNLDNAIDAFFQESGTTATRQQCDDFALARGAPVKPVPIQGTFSYTVLAGASKIFQFRVASSVIDIELSRLASATHGELVPSCTYHGTIGSSQPLSIYEMNNLPGTPYILARDTSIPQPLDSAARQHKTVRDLAKSAPPLQSSDFPRPPDQPFPDSSPNHTTTPLPAVPESQTRSNPSSRNSPPPSPPSSPPSRHASPPS